MTDPFRRPDLNGDTNVRSGSGLRTVIPRWVKAFGIIAIVLVLLIVIHLFAGGALVCMS